MNVRGLARSTWEHKNTITALKKLGGPHVATQCSQSTDFTGEIFDLPILSQKVTNGSKDPPGTTNVVSQVVASFDIGDGKCESTDASPLTLLNVDI